MLVNDSCVVDHNYNIFIASSSVRRGYGSQCASVELSDAVTDYLSMKDLCISSTVSSFDISVV